MQKETLGSPLLRQVFFWAAQEPVAVEVVVGALLVAVEDAEVVLGAAEEEVLRRKPRLTLPKQLARSALQ